MFKKEPKKWDRDKLMEMAHIANLFQEELVKDFFDRTEYNLWKSWTSSKDAQKREEIYLQSQGLAAFRNFIAEVIQDGKMAAKEIEEKNKRFTNRQ